MNIVIKSQRHSVTESQSARFKKRPEDRICKFSGFSVILLLLVFYSFRGFGSGPDETVKLIAAGIQAGNAAAVSKHFNTMVDLSLPGYEDTYSKTQAGQILKDFFAQNPVQKFKITKQGASEDGSQYAIGELETSKKNYRVYFLIKAVGGNNLVHQLQIQEN